MIEIADYAAYLLDEARSSIAALHQFKILYDPDNEGFHFFFEGQDDALFYMPPARAVIGSTDVFTYDCGGKRNVVEVRDSIKNDNYDLERCLFFVDRDHDDYLDCQVEIDEHTYLTDNYSIENDIVGEQATDVILSDILRISPADPHHKNIKIYMQAGVRDFYVKIQSLCAWIIAGRQHGCILNLNNTSGLKKIVAFSGNCADVLPSGFVEFKKRVVINGAVPPLSSVIAWNRRIGGHLPKTWVRGKYDVWSYHTLLIGALEAANRSIRAVDGKPIRIPSAIREGKFFELLGGRIPPPASLRSFYDRKLALS